MPEPLPVSASSRAHVKPTRALKRGVKMAPPPTPAALATGPTCGQSGGGPTEEVAAGCGATFATGRTALGSPPAR